MPTACRDAVLQWIGDRYGAEPEYLWRKYPTYAVFRRQNNRKWFAALMEVSRKQLSLEGAEMVDILDLKCDPRLIGTLRESSGFLPAYHMNKKHWYTIILDGSVSFEEICQRIDKSYLLAQKR